MSALTADTNLPSRENVKATVYPVADNVQIYKGSLVNIDASGYARPGRDQSGEVCAGVANQRVDNTGVGHVAGGKKIAGNSGRVYTLPTSGATQATVGTTQYVTDSATVGASSTNTVVVGICCAYNSSTSIDVLIAAAPSGISGVAGLTATAGELNKLHSVTGGTAAASKGVVLDASSRIDNWKVTTLLSLLGGGLFNLAPYTAGVQGATANVIDVTKSCQHWAMDSATGAANAVTPSAAGAAGDLLLLKYSAVTNTVTMTFGAGFKPSATLAVTASHYAYIMFQSDGTNYNEVFRSAIITS